MHHNPSPVTLTVTAKGQITLKKDVLEHLGVKTGEQVEATMLPHGQLLLAAPEPRGSIDDFIGMFAGTSERAFTIEEINEAIADGWAGLVKD